MIETAEGDAIVDLYFTLLTRWNDKDALGMAALLTDDGQMVGFDGSLMEGPADVAAALGAIFNHHATAAYVAKVKRVQMIGPDAGLLRAMVGMVPRGLSDLSPMVNAVQTLVASRVDGSWRVALLQSTPAAFHGRPQMVDAFSDELREVLRTRGVPGHPAF